MKANNVYQEMIQDKHHIHMNATKWTTLSDFVQYLGKTGKCVVEETERGWYVTYIERDPTILAQQENYQRRVDAERRQEERLAKQMELQRIEAAKLMDRAGIGLKVEASKVLGENGGGGGDAADKKSIINAPIELKLSTVGTMMKKNKRKTPHGILFEDDSEQDEEEEEKEWKEQQALEKSQAQNTRESQSLSYNKISHPEKRQRQQETTIANTTTSSSQLQDVRTKNWLTNDILVRIISKKFANGQFYKRKGIIQRVYDDDKFTAQVEILDSGPDQRDGGDILDVDQKYLETVVPKDGKKVRIVNGKGRGMLAILQSADHEKCRGTLELVDNGKILKKVDFDDFSKAV